MKKYFVFLMPNKIQLYRNTCGVEMTFLVCEIQIFLFFSPPVGTFSLKRLVLSLKCFSCGNSHLLFVTCDLLSPCFYAPIRRSTNESNWIQFLCSEAPISKLPLSLNCRFSPCISQVKARLCKRVSQCLRWRSGCDGRAASWRRNVCGSNLAHGSFRRGGYCIRHARLRPCRLLFVFSGHFRHKIGWEWSWGTKV